VKLALSQVRLQVPRDLLNHLILQRVVQDVSM
jgi:hypothetical protein